MGTRNCAPRKGLHYRFSKQSQDFLIIKVDKEFFYLRGIENDLNVGKFALDIFNPKRVVHVQK